MHAYFSRVDAHTRNLHDMMRHAGVDMARLATERHGQTAATVIRACVACRAPGLCRSWLDALPADADILPPRFCPNRDRFAAARLSQGGGRRNEGPGSL